MSVRGAISDVFHPSWLLAGIGIGLALQFLGWITSFGLIAGLPSYFIMGIIIGWASPGDTIIEPGVAAFIIALLGFIVDHLLLTVVGIGIVLGVGYGIIGLVIGMAGGWVGERIQNR